MSTQLILPEMVAHVLDLCVRCRERKAEFCDLCAPCEEAEYQAHTPRPPVQQPGGYYARTHFDVRSAEQVRADYFDGK